MVPDFKKLHLDKKDMCFDSLRLKIYEWLCTFFVMLHPQDGDKFLGLENQLQHEEEDK